MTYSITKTDGQELIKLGENIIDTETVSGIGLIGKLTPNYGETQSNNFVHLVENFAKTSAPENPMRGQLWFQKDSTYNGGKLFVYLGSEWIRISTLLNEKPSNPTNGDMYYDDENKAFYIYDNTLENPWLKIGPSNYLYNMDETETIMHSGLVYSYTMPSSEVNASYLVTISAVGKNAENSLVSVTEDKSLAIITKCLVERHRNPDGSITASMVGNQSNEIIGMTEGLNREDFDIQVIVYSDKIDVNVISLDGFKWTVNTKIVKVY